MRGRCSCLDLFLLFKGYEECCLFFSPPSLSLPRLSCVCMGGRRAGRGDQRKASLWLFFLTHREARGLGF